MTKDSKLNITVEEMAKYIAVTIAIYHQKENDPVPIPYMMATKDAVQEDIIDNDSIPGSIKIYDEQIDKFTKAYKQNNPHAD